MILYLADSSWGNIINADKALFSRNLRRDFLISYAFFKKKDMGELIGQLHHPVPNFIFDSGAYSAFSQGKKISVYEYAEWLFQNKQWCSSYVNLDVIGNAEGSYKNWLYLKSQGLSPIPVYHVGEDIQYLNEMLNSTDYIGLGGMVGKSKATNIRFAITCFKASQKYPNIKFHAFGQTSITLMTSFRWYSVDSSGWGAGFRYGRIPIWNGKRFSTMSMSDKGDVYKNYDLLKKMGFNADNLLHKRGSIYHQEAAMIGAVSYQLLAQRIKEHV